MRTKWNNTLPGVVALAGLLTMAATAAVAQTTAAPPQPRATAQATVRPANSAAQAPPANVPRNPAERRAHLLRLQAQQYFYSAPPRARTMLMQALALAGAAPSRVRLQLLLDLGSMNRAIGDLSAAQTYAQQALALALRTPCPAPELRPEVFLNMGQMASINLDRPANRRWLEKCLAELDAHGPPDSPVFPNVLSLLVPVYFDADQPAAASRAFRRCRALLHRYPHEPVAEVYALGEYGHGLITRHPDSAAYYLKQAAALAQRLRNPSAESFAVMRLARLARSQQDWPALLVLGQRVRRLNALVGGNAVQEMQILDDVALAHRKLGYGLQAYDTLKLTMGMMKTLYGQQRQQEAVRFESNLQTIQQKARTRELELQAAAAAERNAAQRRLLRGGAAALAALLLGLAGLGWLVGQLRRSRAALAAARASQDRLYAIVAHDLRGPVTALAGVAGQLEHYVARQDLASLQRLPPLVHRAVAGVNGLLDNLLSWAAAQTGELRARPEALPAAELLAEVAALYAPVAAGKDIALALDPAAAPAGLAVWADRNMTRTILRNAVGNAVKFTPAGGRVTLSAHAGAAAGRTVLAVHDSGPGLPPAELAAWASGAGELVRRAGSRNEPGTGLGLRLAQTFAQRQGGAVRLASLPERGTAFELDLPAAGA